MEKGAYIYVAGMALKANEIDIIPHGAAIKFLVVTDGSWLLIDISNTSFCSYAEATYYCAQHGILMGNERDWSIISPYIQQLDELCRAIGTKEISSCDIWLRVKDGKTKAFRPGRKAVRFDTVKARVITIVKV